MVLGIDLLVRLQTRGDTAQGLSSLIRGTEQETQAALDILLQQELVSRGQARWGGEATGMTVYLITPAGTELTNRVLDRYAAQVASASNWGAPERFLLALADSAHQAKRSRLFSLLDSLQAPPSPPNTHDAFELTRAALRYARRALQEEHSNSAVEAGLATLRFADLEDAEHVAEQLRDYRDRMGVSPAREIIDAAATVCDRAWEVRPLGPRDPNTGVSRARDVDSGTYEEVADLTAGTLLRLAAHFDVDVVNEAETLLAALRPTPRAG